jgi:hypothetical protein
MPTQSLPFVGETATPVGDGYAGFRVGRTYELQVERRDDGTVAIGDGPPRELKRRGRK